MTPNIEKVHRAAARASQQTGLPIMAHSRPASGTGPEQMKIFSDGCDEIGSAEMKALSMYLQMTLYGPVERFFLDTFSP